LSNREGRREPFPEWLKKRVKAGDPGRRVRELLRSLRLDTVCRAAHCPNQCECFLPVLRGRVGPADAGGR